jgi:hypothetical protein
MEIEKPKTIQPIAGLEGDKPQTLMGDLQA